MRAMLSSDVEKFMPCVPLILAATVFVTVSCAAHTKKKKDLILLFFFYLALNGILCFTLFRTPGKVYPPKAIDLSFHGTWRDGLQGQIFVIENFVLFLPLGFFGRALFQNTGKTVLFGFLLSLCIEVLQVIFKLGYGEVNDLIQNTLGTVTGACLYLYLVNYPPLKR